MNPLLESVSANDFGRLKKLLGAKTLKQEQLDEALRASAAHGHAHFVLPLVHHGADPASTNHIGWTVLHTAVELGQHEVVRQLIVAGAELDTPAKDGMTALHLAVDVAVDAVEQRGGNLDLGNILLLLRAGADANATDSEGASVRDWAADADCREILDLLRTRPSEAS